MKLNKQDLMQLPKERLAELLVEMQGVDNEEIFPIIPTAPSTFPCDGRICTNPYKDCINCPRTAGGGNYTTAPNTATNISTLKAEGNTSFTDGKEHNPSFID